jgi:hypothetical protein
MQNPGWCCSIVGALYPQYPISELPRPQHLVVPPCNHAGSSNTLHRLIADEALEAMLNPPTPDAQIDDDDDIQSDEDEEENDETDAVNPDSDIDDQYHNPSGHVRVSHTCHRDMQNRTAS